jgi:hypothetical protein
VPSLLVTSLSTLKRSLFGFLICVSFAAQTELAAQADELDKGHRVLLQHGLQIQAQAFYQAVDVGSTDYKFDSKRYLDANFTGINWHHRPINAAFAAEFPKFPWGKWTTVSNILSSEDLPYSSTLVTVQFGDEQSLDDPQFRADCAKWFRETRPHFPNTILYTNQLAFNATNANVAGYMRESRPDMMVMDSYRWRIGNVEGAWHLLSDLQRYRKFALGGHDGTGRRPIPYGVFTQVFHGEDKWRDPSESELRLNHFAAWALGYTVTFAFTYNYGTTSLFSPGGDTRHPTATFGQLREINRQGRNLGPALVRLVSNDVLFVAGQHQDASGKVADNRVPIDFSSSSTGLNTIIKDRWIRSIQRVVNLGTKNNGLKGDVIISWFQPLDESFDGRGYDGEQYFMITNALVDPTGSAADTRQTIEITYASDVPPQLQRISRDTGQVELVDLEKIPDTGGRRKLVLTLDGGTADLFKFNTGAPFVGASIKTRGSAH